MKKLINYFSIIIFCLLIISCEEDPDIIDPDEVGIWKYYNTSNGLTNDYITAIKQDRSGIIWVGTYGGGVCKYDNEQWSSIQVNGGLLDNHIYSIEEDVYDDIWVGTEGGISIIADEDILNLETILDSSFLPLSLFSDSRGWMWIGTTQGIIIYDFNDFYQYSDQDNDLNLIRDITEDNKGQVWLATQGGALYYNEDNGFNVLTVNEGLYNNYVQCIFQDSWGNIWFGHLYSKRITRWNGSYFEYINRLNGYNYAIIWSIVQDHRQKIWFTTNNSGVICYDGIIPETVEIKGGLKDTDIRCSMVDSEGNLWFGSKNHGIQIYLPE